MTRFGLGLVPAALSTAATRIAAYRTNNSIGKMRSVEASGISNAVERGYR